MWLMPFAFRNMPLDFRPVPVRHGRYQAFVPRVVAMCAGSSNVFLNILPANLPCSQMFRCALEETGVAP